eukprot:GHUV01013495.1.p1 GENE.GHUV01013495.1~~GHUV01013495.1.p1  ORF type:complete len:287 (+),score=46.96 GHUV01013495.1:998-1858(+)
MAFALKQQSQLSTSAHQRQRSVCGPLRAVQTDTKSSSIVYDVLKPITSSGQIQELNTGIATFYNESSTLWENVWGEHMHHGYYAAGAAPKTNQQAQIDMIEETLGWAEVTSASSMVDVGCGIGGSSRHISKKFNCKATGITLSPVQAARANELSRKAGLGEQCSFQVADALQQPFADGSFDLVWSMESGEHMPDKQRFVNELVRVCAPGGTIIIVTWCHRYVTYLPTLPMVFCRLQVPLACMIRHCIWFVALVIYKYLATEIVCHLFDPACMLIALVQECHVPCRP